MSSSEDKHVTCGWACEHDPLVDEAHTQLISRQWARAYDRRRTTALSRYRAAVGAVIAKCADSHGDIPGQVCCESCSTTVLALEGAKIDAMRDAKQRFYRCSNMWRKRHPMCECGYLPPDPKPPWLVRTHHARTEFERVFHGAGTGVGLGATARNELRAAVTLAAGNREVT